MRPISADALGALSGSRESDRLSVDLWYDGRLIRPLEISSWSLDWDASRQIHGGFSAVVLDPDGSLAPWHVADELGPGGSWVQVSYIVGSVNYRVPIGWYRLTESEPDEEWILYSDRLPIWLSSGTIPIDADDASRQIELERFMGTETPRKPTVIAEITRLLDGIIPVVVAPGVKDRTLPASTAYDNERIDAVEDLLTELDAVWRISHDRVFMILPSTTTEAPVRTIRLGKGGTFVRFERKFSINGLYNAAVSKTTTEDGDPLTGRAYEEYGKLRFGGPHGHVPIMHQASLAKTQSAVDADAKTILANRLARRAMRITVICGPDPSIELFDTVTVETPAGPLTGQALRISLKGNKKGTEAMALVLEVDFDVLKELSRKVKRHGRRRFSTFGRSR